MSKDPHKPVCAKTTSANGGETGEAFDWTDAGHGTVGSRGGPVGARRGRPYCCRLGCHPSAPCGSGRSATRSYAARSRALVQAMRRVGRNPWWRRRKSRWPGLAGFIRRNQWLWTWDRPMRQWTCSQGSPRKRARKRRLRSRGELSLARWDRR